MSAGRKELLCGNCRKRVSYQILKRPAKRIVKGVEIVYEEYYGICDECKEELMVPGIDDQNEESIEVIYRKEKELIQIQEIKEILRRYNIEKRPLSKLMGFGELTITRYLDGQLPSKKYSDYLYQVLSDDQNMIKIIEKNKSTVSQITTKKVLQEIEKRKKEMVVRNSADKVALYIVNSGREITNLLLQKILYYVKGISCVFDGTSMIPEPCEAWKFGPVFPTVYDKYKDFGGSEIKSCLSAEYVSELLTEKEKDLVDYVLNTIGIYNAWFLKDLTHAEKPWIKARHGLGENDFCNDQMDDEIIEEYFKEMDLKYDFKTADGINRYIKDMQSSWEYIG